MLKQQWPKSQNLQGDRPLGGNSIIDPETMPLIAQLTQKGHRIGVADDINFEYGLTCILDHASRLIDAG